ncbi:MAG TPA: hypothetical protein VII98_14870 [Solirubrobacteraceae bacterium]
MSTPDVSTRKTPDQALAWEAANRTKASIAAWVAAALALGGGIVTSLAYSALPAYPDKVVTITDAMGDLAAGRTIPAGRAAAQLLWISDHPAALTIGPLLTALSALLVFGVLAYLFEAVKARALRFGRSPLIFAAIGAVAYGVGTAVVGIGRVVAAGNFSPTGTNADAVDALGSGPIAVGTVLQLLGSFSLGFAFIMIALNAMRVGLLTRFMGVLGMIVGATFVLPLDQQGIIRSFWLLAIGFLFAGRWPRGAPPAWRSGQAEPWPSRSRVTPQQPAGAQAVLETPAPAPPPQPSAGQRRKKRKKK